MTTELGRTLPLSLALVVLFLAACRSPATQATIYIDTTQIPANLQTEYEAFATNCSKCHGLSRALNANVKDPNHWDLYVARMMRTAGSAISPKEGKQIVRFLHWYTKSYDKGEAEKIEPFAPSTSVSDPAPVNVPPPEAPVISVPPPEAATEQPANTGDPLPAQPGEAQP